MAKRAVGDKDKEARRADILALAARLLGERPYDAIRMADLAAELDLAKGTLYLYFPSKESLFLALLSERLERALDQVFDHLSATIPTTEGEAIEGVAREMAAALASDPVLPRLLALVHAVLEQKVPWEEAVGFKRHLADFIEESGAELSRLMPRLGNAGATKFFLYIYAQIVGLVQLTDISPFMARIGQEPGLGVFRLGLESTLRDSARTLLSGLLAGGGGAT